jgi:hypothetical protein
MTPVEFATYIRLKTKTNVTTFSDADLLIFANIVKNQVVDRALEVDEDIFLLPTYMNLVANRREYPLYSALLSRIKRVEAKLDGTNWLKLEELDISDLKFPINSEALITANFGNEEGRAKFDIMRNALWIYSGAITNVTGGLAVWLNTRPENIASLSIENDMSLDPSTTTHGIPAALHKVIATGVVIEWKESRPKPIPLTEREQKWEFDLEKAIQTLKKSNYDREIIAELQDETDGSEF